MEYLSYILAMAIALIGSLIWLNMISILKDNNYNVGFFGNHAKIISDFFLLIKREDNEKLKMKYIKLFVLFILSIVLFCFSVLYNLS